MCMCSLDSNDDGISTTTGTPLGFTARYAAPEAHEHEERNRLVDIYSLGCIIIEMLSCLHGFKLSTVKDWWKRKDKKKNGFYQNPEAREVWCSHLADQLGSRVKDQILLEIATYMLYPERKGRPSAQLVVDKLRDLEARLPLNSAIIGRCCRDQAHKSCNKEGPVAVRLSQIRVRRLWLKMAAYWRLPLQRDQSYVILSPELEVIFAKDCTGYDDSYKYLDYYFKSPKRIRAGCDAVIYATTTSSATGPTNDFWRTISQERGDLQNAGYLPRLFHDSIHRCNPLRVHMVSIEIKSVARSWTQVSGFGGDWTKSSVTVRIFAVPMPPSKGPLYGSYFFVVSWQNLLPIKSIC
jgi:serine/threonine protein kinase